VPVNFLTEEQRQRYGRFNADPDPAQLGGFFHLDVDARRHAMAANGARNQLGWAVQLGAARFLGAFLPNPEDVPTIVAEHLARQLGLDPGDLKGYGEHEARWDHQADIRARYGYRAFGPEEWLALMRWLYTRAWTANERPSVLFDLATNRLVEAKILLPGVTVLERLVAAVRDRTAARAWRVLAAAPSPLERARLLGLVDVAPGQRVSDLDRMRKSPVDISGAGVVKALDRYTQIAALGAGGWDLSAVPPGRVAALARFAKAARVQAVDELAPDRRLATLVAFAAEMEPPQPMRPWRCSTCWSATWSASPATRPARSGCAPSRSWTAPRLPCARSGWSCAPPTLTPPASWRPPSRPWPSRGTRRPTPSARSPSSLTRTSSSSSRSATGPSAGSCRGC
jgi:Domain of unknown function (DUF4158)